MGRNVRRKGKRRRYILGICIVALVMCAIPLIHEKNTYNTEEALQEVDGRWELLLVNKNHPIPDDYEVELTELKNGQCVDERIYPELQKMMDAARKEGIYPVVGSGFRTREKQQSLMDEKTAEFLDQGYSEREAETMAGKWVAEPGTSEHELGLAVDINADKTKSDSGEVYRWLYRNGYKYGFILRYPEDKTDITGTDYEPWHYRYVGKSTAAEIHKRGICLEEYAKMSD